MEKAVPSRFTLYSFRDYLELCKPKVVALLMLTAVVGMFLAVDPTQQLMPSWDALIFGNIGIALAASAAAIINHVVDRKIDALMVRTTGRPIPTGKVPPGHAVILAAVLSVISMLLLALLVNPLTAWLTLFGLVGYAFIYTMYLKRATPQNIVIGGLSGALPPLLGWTAVTGGNGQISVEALILVLIIYTWTPPHFWALAIHRRDDYAKANIPMLPVTHGIEFTKTSIILYTILLILATWLPFLIQMSGVIYFVSANILGSWFLYHTLKLKYNPEPNSAMRTFGVSITYLLALFLVLLVDHYTKLWL